MQMLNFNEIMKKVILLFQKMLLLLKLEEEQLKQL